MPFPLLHIAAGMGHNFTAAIYHFYVIGRFMDEVPLFGGRFGLKDVQFRTAVFATEGGSRTRNLKTGICRRT